MREIISLPIFITKEGDWFVACCPILDIATQGRSEEEVRDNMKDLIGDYMQDPDTEKPDLDTIISTSVVMTTIPFKVKDVKTSKTSAIAPA